MAEHLLKKMLKDAGHDGVTVTSAGVSPAQGLAFPAEAQRALAMEGVGGVSHKTQGLTKDLIKTADIILAMESRHKSIVIDRFPEAGRKTFVLNAYAGLGGDHDGIEDPFGGPPEVYVQVLAKIKKALTKVSQKLKES